MKKTIIAIACCKPSLRSCWERFALGVAEVRSRSPQKPTSSRPDFTSRANIPPSNLPSTIYMSIVGIAGSHVFISMIFLFVTMYLKHIFCHQGHAYCTIRGRPNKSRRLLAMYDSNIWETYKTEQRRGEEICGMGSIGFSFIRCLNDYTFPSLLYTSHAACRLRF